MVNFCPLRQKTHSLISKFESSVLLKTDSERLAVTGKLSSIQSLDLKADLQGEMMEFLLLDRYKTSRGQCCIVGQNPAKMT